MKRIKHLDQSSLDSLGTSGFQMESAVSQTLRTAVPLTSFATALDDITEANTTRTEPNSSCEFSKIPAHPVFIFAYLLVFLVSLVLNCITMRVYFCTKHCIQSSVTVYMKNLAAADFFLCLCLPLRIANYTNSSVIMRNIYCSFGATAFYLNMYASILFMDFIAANRYLKIVRPLETHALQTVRTARHISAATWLSLLAMSSIYLILFLLTSWNLDQKPDKIGCEALHSPQLSLVYKITHSVSMVIFTFVLVSLIALYWGTLQKVRKAQLSTQTTSSNNKFRKSKRNMLVLVVVFCVCFVPYHLVRLPYAFIKLQTKNCTAQAFYVLKELTVLLSVLNACLDPFIYFIFCKAFRAQLNLRKDKDSLKDSDDRGQQRRMSNMLSYIETKISTLRRESVI
ncbi:P2Y purinoceptor 14-like isoform X1 [Ctenopharyngodon idella]|uniref:P2Y purinoceptor 14-like isoform X1 n=2 Tax=Ctenopharyngodon idella TaxID=7959 RepID=UPI002231E5EE|nr:P2Y purinoceptor 14-like isoform X1 [Ctenopharyngodon idella]